MPQQMKRRITQRVDRVEDAQSHASDLPLRPAVPKLVGAGYRQALHPVIPELKMQVDAERNFGIEVIAAPLPSCFADENRQMIGGESLQRLDGFVAGGDQSISCGIDVLGRCEEVDVVLRSQFRPDAEERTMRDPFQGDEIYSRGLEA